MMQSLVNMFKYKLHRKQNKACSRCSQLLSLREVEVVCKYDIEELLYYAGDEITLHWVYEAYWEDWLYLVHKHCYEGANQEFGNEAVTDDIIRKIDMIKENLSTNLGIKKKGYEANYNSSLLTPISRSIARDEIGYENIFFNGLDIWNAWEVSWLDRYGRACYSPIKIGYDSDSENIIESKSFKLYLNSFNSTNFANEQDVIEVIKEDVQRLTKATSVVVDFMDYYKPKTPTNFLNIDNIYVPNEEKYEYDYNPGLLEIQPTTVSRTKEINLYSSLFKSNCRHSGLPDWAEVYLSYLPSSSQLTEKSFLKYLISYRNHQGFHEECCEKIFYDLVTLINPIWIRLELNYTRRGGLDINPIRIHSMAGEYKYSFNREYNTFKRTFRQ